MHIGVAKGAAANGSFASYVTYLEANHWTPPGSKDWVDQIRSKGNEATHEIVMSTSDEAQTLVSFSEMLLRFIYEFPAKAGANKPAPKTGP